MIILLKRVNQNVHHYIRHFEKNKVDDLVILNMEFDREIER
jgi:hypothetical protein